MNEDEVSANVQRAFEEGAAEARRILAFQDAVREMPGPLGSLLRQVAHAWSDHEQAMEFGGTTAGEEIRLRGVLGEAMSTLDWLREGEQS